MRVVLEGVEQQLSSAVSQGGRVGGAVLEGVEQQLSSGGRGTTAQQCCV